MTHRAALHAALFYPSEQCCIPGFAGRYYRVDATGAAEHELELRAQQGRLSFADRETIKRAQAIRAGRAANKAMAAIAAPLKVTRQTLARLEGTDLYAAALRVADSPFSVRAPATEKKNVEMLIADARGDLADKLVHAAEFITHCFERDETTAGRPYRDPGLAQWATDRIHKGTGLSDREGAAAAPPVVITADAMRVMLGAIRGDDARRERDVTPPAIDVHVERV